MRKKVLMFLSIAIFALFGSGITYSIFTAGSKIDIDNQGIAKFVFNTEKLDHLELNLVDINPGDEDLYSFTVSNTSNRVQSNITVEYQIIIKTMHLIPLELKLYKLDEDDDETLIMNCDETYSRNSDNELVCKSSEQLMAYSSEAFDNYKLKVSFPISYSDDVYSNLVDYIDLEIKSWQKTS